MTLVLSAKPIAKMLRDQNLRIIDELGIRPTMLLIQVGEDPASAYYVQNIVKTGEKLGCEVSLQSLRSDIDEHDLQDILKQAADNPSIDGIMLQKPLPRHFDTSAIDLCIHPDKDIDATHPMNLGKIMSETDDLVPCTAAAVIETLKYYEIDPCGKHVVILGRSNVLGKPLANLLLQKKAFANATVSVCHSKTPDIALISKSADILVAAIGKALYVKPEMIKENAILIDVGINLQIAADGSENYVGDIDYNACFDKALAITPVPGGIGSITTALLFRNLIRAALICRGINKSIDDFS